ncbi:hypothetical protein [Alteromonas gracilis]|uniref:hypothetical protein n=1 Tax=Alteromonas gracilis TaxID=1479524 RepID=UPI003734C830
MQHAIMLGVMCYLLLNISSLPTNHQLIAVVTVVVMSVQNSFILSKSNIALAIECPRLLIFPLLWVASGMGMAAFVFGALSLASLLVLANAVRHRNHRRPLNLTNEPENLA